MLPGVPEPSKPAFGHSVMHEAPMQKPASARIFPAVNTLLLLYERTHLSSDMYQPPPQFCQSNPPLPVTRKWSLVYTAPVALTAPPNVASLFSRLIVRGQTPFNAHQLVEPAPQPRSM